MLRRFCKTTDGLSPVRLATSDKVMLGFSLEKLVSTLNPLARIMRCSRERSSVMVSSQMPLIIA